MDRSTRFKMIPLHRQDNIYMSTGVHSIYVHISLIRVYIMYALFYEVVDHLFNEVNIFNT